MKRKFLSFIIFIIIFILFEHSVYSENVCRDNEGNRYLCNDVNSKILDVSTSVYDNITPNYQIISIVDKTTINSGDNFTISFQISGRGKVVSNKLITYFPIELLKEKPIYYMYISKGTDENGTDYCIWYDKYPQTEIANKEGAQISFVDVTFKHDIIDSDMVFGEKTINGHRPVKIEAHTNNNIPSGDYIIKIQFFYSDGTSWYSSQDEVIIHIKTWAEQNEIIVGFVIPMLTTIIGAFLGAFLPLIIAYLLIRRKENKNQSLSNLPKTNNKKVIIPKKKDNNIKKIEK